jgi:hypothetical protein
LREIVVETWEDQARPFQKIPTKQNQLKPLWNFHQRQKEVMLELTSASRVICMLNMLFVLLIALTAAQTPSSFT